MSRRASLVTLLSRRVSQSSQLTAMLAYADDHELTAASIVMGDPSAAIRAVQVGTADVVLAPFPDSAGALVRSPVEVAYVAPPAVVAPRSNAPDDQRPLGARNLGGVPGLLVLQALERTGGDVALVARIFDLPPAMVEEYDRERRARSRRAR